ncbi:MAG: agmatinase [Deltaproteobacteria bacterium]|nr:agmatinase [Deltaproteobacteria bacterium]
MTQTLRFLGTDVHPCAFDQARVVVLPIPYEGTVSYLHGASQGPGAVLAASDQLEMYDDELDLNPDQAGVFTLPPVAALPQPEDMMKAIHQAALPSLRAGKLLLGLGGEHSVSYGLFTAHLEAGTAGAPGQPFSVLQIDAHGDLRQEYHGSPFSHACIMARALDLGLSLVQVGIRAVCQEERNLLRSRGLEENVFWARTIAAQTDDRWMDQVIARLGPKVYITVDVDGFDPSVFPGTGTPVPGGLGWHQGLRLLRKVAQARRVIGMDIVEVSPQPPAVISEFNAALLAYKMIGYALEQELRVKGSK